MAASKVTSNEILKKSLKSSQLPESKCFPSVVKVKSEDVDSLEIDLSVKCRGCFVEDPEMHYLFTVFDQQLSLADILIQTTQFECKEDDGLPPYLCTRCTTSLIDFFNFKIQFQKTDIYVKSLLGKDPSYNTDVKIEIDDDFDGGSNVTDHDLPKPEPKPKQNKLKPIEDKFMPDISDIPGTYCEICKIVFEDGGICQTHMAVEHGENPFIRYHLFRKMIAENEKTQSESRRRRRIMEAEEREQLLQKMPGKLCRLCRRKFPEDEFKLHWESHKVHICELCGHKFIRKSDLDIHKLCVHNNVRNHCCTLCVKSFKTKQLLKRHQVVHLNPRSYCCDICGQRFNDSGTLKTHIQLKHIGNRDFVCPICGLSYPMKSTLDKHILRHNKDRPPPFHCDACSGTFRDKSSLKRHYLIKHSGNFVRPRCEHCGKTYCSTTKLRFHIEKYHSGKVVTRKRRSPNKIKQEFSSDESSDSQSSDSFEESNRTGQVRNVGNFYRSTGYSPKLKDEDPEYLVSEEEMDRENSESE